MDEINWFCYNDTKEECQVFSLSWLVGQTAQLPEYNVGILALNVTANQGYK